MHPEKTVTMEELDQYAAQELVNDMECINGSYVVLIYNEQEQGSEWYALKDADQAQVEALAERAGVKIKEEKISPPVIFIMYMIQFSICYGVVWGIWKVTGNSALGREKSITGYKNSRKVDIGSVIHRCKRKIKKEPYPNKMFGQRFLLCALI